MKTLQSKSANEIAIELEMEAKRLLELSRMLKGEEQSGRKPADRPTVGKK